MRRTSLRLSVLLGMLVAFAAPAVAAYVCHPDPAGTRVLALHGNVVGYARHGSDLVVAVQAAGACRTVTWSPASGRTAPDALTICIGDDRTDSA